MFRSLLQKSACLALTLWFRSLKLQWSGDSGSGEPAIKNGKSAIPFQEKGVLVLWHEDLLPCLWAFRKQGVCVLFSKSKDGDWGAALASHWGYRVIRGSSSRSYTSVKTLARLLRKEKASGRNRKIGSGPGRMEMEPLQNRTRPDSDIPILVGMALDGPRGPARRPKEGVLWLHRQARCPVYTLRASCTREKRLNSWDRLRIPLPFSGVRLLVGVVKNPESSRQIAEALSHTGHGTEAGASSRVSPTADTGSDVYQVI